MAAILPTKCLGTNVERESQGLVYRREFRVILWGRDCLGSPTWSRFSVVTLRLAIIFRLPCSAGLAPVASWRCASGTVSSSFVVSSGSVGHLSEPPHRSSVWRLHGGRLPKNGCGFQRCRKGRNHLLLRPQHDVILMTSTRWIGYFGLSLI